MIIESFEYSVCIECFTLLADGCNDNTSEERDAYVWKRMHQELGGKEGHWVTGVEQTEEDPEGTGYEEFSRQDCELCRSGLAGERHGVTMHLTVESVRRRVMWEIDVEFPVDTPDRDIAKAVAETYFQERIAAGEPETACVFKVVSELGPNKLRSEAIVDLSK